MKNKNILRLLNVGDKIFIMSKTALDREATYTEAIVTKKNTTSFYFKYNLEEEHSWRVDKTGSVEITFVGYYKQVLLNEAEVEEHREAMKKVRLRNEQLDYIKKKLHLLSFEEIDELYKKIKGMC